MTKLAAFFLIFLIISIFYMAAPWCNDEKKSKFVLYYAPWCKYSRDFLPVWDIFEKNMKGNSKISVHKVNCDESEECKNKNIPGFPSCILHKDGKDIQFKGDRTVKGLNDFIKHNIS